MCQSILLLRFTHDFTLVTFKTKNSGDPRGSTASFPVKSAVIVLGAGVFARADVIVSADTDTARAVVDVGTTFDLFEAAAFSGAGGRAAVAETA